MRVSDLEMGRAVAWVVSEAQEEVVRAAGDSVVAAEVEDLAGAEEVVVAEEGKVAVTLIAGDLTTAAMPALETVTASNSDCRVPSS